MILHRIAFVTLLGLAASVPAIAQHAHTSSAEAASTSPHARFRADAPLSREMAGIRGAFAAKLAAIHANTLDPAGYAALGAEVETRVQTMIRECRLPPEADGVLHGYIGRMLASAARLRQAELDSTAHRTAAVEVIDAYNEYGGRFIDPVWKPLAP
jgi:hypothetical protein